MLLLNSQNRDSDPQARVLSAKFRLRLACARVGSVCRAALHPTETPAGVSGGSVPPVEKRLPRRRDGVGPLRDGLGRIGSSKLAQPSESAPRLCRAARLGIERRHHSVPVTSKATQLKRPEVRK
jgi:hypothetical protein